MNETVLAMPADDVSVMALSPSPSGTRSTGRASRPRLHAHQGLRRLTVMLVADLHDGGEAVAPAGLGGRRRDVEAHDRVRARRHQRRAARRLDAEARWRLDFDHDPLLAVRRVAYQHLKGA